MILERGEPIISTAQIGPVAREAVLPFDLDINKVNRFRPFIKPELPQFTTGVIVGSSGSGKSTLLREFGTPEDFIWDDRSVADYFSDAEQASQRLAAAGLNSVPLWLLKYDELSNGEQFRVRLARQLKSMAVIDEFTSVVDRNVAKSASVSAARYIRNNGLEGVVFATCHRDVIDWLSPTWVIDTDAGEIYFQEQSIPQWHKQFVTGDKIGTISVTV